jgi:membrane protein
VSGLVADLWAVLRRFREDEGFVLASALSFSAVLCLAPLVLILFALAGFLMQSDQIADYLFDAATLLVPAYGAELAEFLALLTRERAVTGLLGLASWAVFATQLFSLTRLVLNRAFRVPVRRGYVHGFLLDLLAVATVGSLALVFALVLIVVIALSGVVGRVMPLPPLSPRALAIPLIYVTGFACLFLIYRALPNTAVPVRGPLTATLVVAVMWEIARRAFAAYVRAFGTYGRLYGSFGIGIAVLVWIYYSAIIFVLGAEVAALTNERAAARAPDGVT